MRCQDCWQTAVHLVSIFSRLKLEIDLNPFTWPLFSAPVLAWRCCAAQMVRGRETKKERASWKSSVILQSAPVQCLGCSTVQLDRDKTRTTVVSGSTVHDTVSLRPLCEISIPPVRSILCSKTCPPHSRPHQFKSKMVSHGEQHFLVECSLFFYNIYNVM